MDKRQHAAEPINIFYSYAPEDEKFLQELEKHLSLLRRENLITDWHEQKISAGAERTPSINSHLNTASIILLLISPDFIASDYCYSIEMQRALERHNQGQARVIPILVRAVNWQDAPFAHLQCLPRNQSPVKLWPDQDAAFAEIVQDIRAEVEALRGSTSMRKPASARQAAVIVTSREEQSRQRFLKLVRETWISGVLERSLYNATLITLGLHEQPAAVANPWHLVVQETDQPARPLSGGTRITHVYDDAGGSLLILGEPGAGKTTLLLELARDLVERAEQDAQYALPAVFNLSSWVSKHQPLAAWLVEELHEKYNVPRKLGEAWIEHEQLLPLLDGLDEVVQEQRSACVAAINQYQQEHHLAALVICSRSAEYLAQATRLALHKSVMVQPLTAQQIDDYLSSAGEQLTAVREALRDDAGLQEMATQPLMLNILTLAYQGLTLENLLPSESPAILRRQIFKQYVERMLQRRGVETRYAPQQIRNWLTYLARQMKLHGQTEFYIERIEMGWLTGNRWLKHYQIATVSSCVLVGGLVGVFSALSFGLLASPIGGLGFGLLGGIMCWLAPDIQPTESFIWSWQIVFKEWFTVLSLIATSCFVSCLDTKPDNILINVLLGSLFGVICGVLYGVLRGGMAKFMPDTSRITTPNQAIRRSAYHSLLIIAISLLFCFLFGILNNRLAVTMIGGFGLLGALGFGGLVSIQHIVLRVLLWHSGVLPWDLPRFLDHAAERILLRKVGGGYIFVHRLLLEYFALLDDDTQAG